MLMHLIGSLLSGLISEKFGRRKAILMINVPLAVCWIILGFSYSYALVLTMNLLIGFCFGLKEAPAYLYISEIR